MANLAETLAEVVALVRAGKREEAFSLLESGDFSLLEKVVSKASWGAEREAQTRGADWAYWLLGRLPNRQKGRITPEMLDWTISLRSRLPKPKASVFAVRSQLKAQLRISR
ncbi:MAG: hypothetical protein QM756_44615 [Polyangiaceae bacterium]